VDFPRYVIVDKAANVFQANDSDLDIAAGAAIKHPIDQWLKERSAGALFYGGTDCVHNKLLVVDPLGAAPKIVVGSANFSVPSTDANDENMLVLKGPAFMREADVYLTEFVRLFDHFNFREWLNSEPADFKPFLEEGPQANGRSWIHKDFDSPQSLSFKRKVAFKNMVVPLTAGFRCPTRAARSAAAATPARASARAPPAPAPSRVRRGAPAHAAPPHAAAAR